ncbi:MAG: transposase, family [Francisellaceae bacterium]|nr:transposase, family [Francisellaceae bacterium]
MNKWLHRNGFSYKKPKGYPYKASVEQQEKFVCAYNNLKASLGIDKLLLRKRSIIETIDDQLKNICQIEHTRHRSMTNFAANLVAGLIAYTHLERKP